MTATPLFTTTIGSHLWGHATAASDIDLLEVYAADPREILAGIGPTRGKAQRSRSCFDATGATEVRA